MNVCVEKANRIYDCTQESFDSNVVLFNLAGFGGAVPENFFYVFNVYILVFFRYF